MKKAAVTLRCSEKQVLPKRTQEVFCKISVLKILTSHNGLYKI